MARNGVVVVGSVSADMTTFSRRLPNPGETILGEDFTLLLGGKGANQAVAAGLAGAPTSFVGCVGDDLFRDMIVTGLEKAGVNLSQLRTVSGPSGIAHIRVDSSAQNDIVVVPQANTHLNESQVDAALTALAPTSSVLLTQLETPATLTEHIVSRARQCGLKVILDPAPAIKLTPEVWQNVDIVTPNETEASLLSGIRVDDLTSAAQAGNWFIAQGVGTAVITLAAQGACVVSEAGVETVSAFPVNAVDTTAAGDAFAGYLGAALASGLELVSAIRIASAAGALTVTKRGASPSLPTRHEVETFLTEQGTAQVN